MAACRDATSKNVTVRRGKNAGSKLRILAETRGSQCSAGYRKLRAIFTSDDRGRPTTSQRKAQP